MSERYEVVEKVAQHANWRKYPPTERVVSIHDDFTEALREAERLGFTLRKSPAVPTPVRTKALGGQS